jgi:hypothetical protein
MGGFSSNYEGGYLDFDDNPKWMSKDNKKESKYAYLRQKKVYHKTSGSSANYLNVLLNSMELLTASEKEKREELCAIDDEDIELTLKSDYQELKVYYEQVYIGSIQKTFEEDGIDNSTVLNDFCFEKNKLKNIEILWDGEGFYLRKTRV